MKCLLAAVVAAASTVISAAQQPADGLLTVYKLHGQTRRYNMAFESGADGSMTLRWGIERNLHWQSGTFTMTAGAVECGDSLSSQMPVDGCHVQLPPNTTYGMVSRRVLAELRTRGHTMCNGLRYQLLDSTAQALGHPLLHVAEAVDGSHMWIVADTQCPRIWRMADNPLGQNWHTQPQ